MGLYCTKLTTHLTSPLDNFAELSSSPQPSQQMHSAIPAKAVISQRLSNDEILPCEDQSNVGLLFCSGALLRPD